MDGVIALRCEIYDHFQASQACRDYFLNSASSDQYQSYYIAMYLLQDSSESLWTHRQVGFNKDPMMAYIEFWGIMQAANIQQDALTQLHQVICERTFDYSQLQAWQKLRRLRIECAGHPTGTWPPVVRSFMGRHFGDYNTLRYERREVGQSATHPSIKLGKLFDAYATEVESEISKILAHMRRRWP